MAKSFLENLIDEVDDTQEELIDIEKSDEEIVAEEKVKADAEAEKAKLEAEKVEVEKKKRGRPAKEVTETKKEEVIKLETKEEVVNDAELFYADVFEITGDSPDEIDFGNVDPLSPQGTVVYTEFKVNKAIEEFEVSLQEKAPLEYQALLMRLEGKDPSEIYTKVGSIDYSKLEISEENIELQKKIIDEDLKRQGIDEDKRGKLIKIIEAEGSLYDESIKSKDNSAKAQKAVLDQQDQQSKAEQAKSVEAQKAFIGVINKTVNSGEVGNFVIPEKDRKAFIENVRANVRFIDGEFYFVETLNNDNYNKVMQTLFFNFKGGNLKELVEKEARTQNVVRLRRSVEASTTNKGGQEQESSVKGTKTWRQEIGLDS